MEDCEAVLSYQSDPVVVRYVPWPVRDATMVETAIAKALHQTTLERQGDFISWALVQQSDGRLVGQMNAMYVSEVNRCGEIGYVVSPNFAGQGFATEASWALVSALFGTQRFRRIIATLDDRNVASRMVVEKLGFRREAHFIGNELFKGEWINTLVYATTIDEWEALADNRV
jgi:RimJ/RimL family protein N-acetyltransferase